MSVQSSASPYIPYVKPGELVTGQITSERLWVESNPGSKGPQDKGKANYEWRWRVRIFNGGMYENVPDDHHPSIRCHRLLADLIIESIEKDLQKYYPMLSYGSWNSGLKAYKETDQTVLDVVDYIRSIN